MMMAYSFLDVRQAVYSTKIYSKLVYVRPHAVVGRFLSLPTELSFLKWLKT